ncbi:MAG: hypothetical protein LCH31_02805 [Actinobacteria bacterium]|nr:hypothetical protein [Actinomycetota bacterium]
MLSVLSVLPVLTFVLQVLVLVVPVAGCWLLVAGCWLLPMLLYRTYMSLANVPLANGI